MLLYQEKIIDHYHYPRNRRVLVDPDFTSGAHNPSCGDSITISGRLQHDIIQEIVFDGAGCVISQAAASLLTQEIQGKKIADVRAMQSNTMSLLLGIQLGPMRMKCALLCMQALHQALSEYCKKYA